MTIIQYCEAREMAKDAIAGVSIPTIAESFGVSPTTVMERIEGLKEADPELYKDAIKKMA